MFLVVIGLDNKFHLVDYFGKLMLATNCGVNFGRNTHNLLSMDNFPKNLCDICLLYYNEIHGVPNFRYDRNINQQNIGFQCDRNKNIFKLDEKNKNIINRNWKILSKYKKQIDNKSSKIFYNNRKIK